MKFIFFAVFVATVYGATEYLAVTKSKPKGEFKALKIANADSDSVNVHVGFEYGKEFEHFVKYETDGERFQIAVKYTPEWTLFNWNPDKRLAVLKLGEQDKEFVRLVDDKSKDLVYFRDVEGILVGCNLIKLDRLCFSFKYGLHFESTRKYHPRFYLTIEGENIVKSRKADKEYKPVNQNDLESSRFSPFRNIRLKSSKEKTLERVEELPEPEDFEEQSLKVEKVTKVPEYLIVSNAEPKRENYASQLSLDPFFDPEIFFFYIGFQQGNQCRRFVKYETKGNWFQIAVKCKQRYAVLGEIFFNQLRLSFTKLSKFIYLKHVKGILYVYDGKHLDRLCFSSKYGLHFESTQTYHPRFYLTIEGENIVKASDADKRPEPIDKTILDDFIVKKHELKHNESIENSEKQVSVREFSVGEPDADEFKNEIIEEDSFLKKHLNAGIFIAAAALGFVFLKHSKLF